MNDHEAEIISVEEVNSFEGYNPNKTNQVINLVQINQPQIQGGLPIEKRSKLSKEYFDAMVKYYNETAAEYGFKVEWDLSSLQSTFELIADDRYEKLLRILVSKSFDKFATIWIQQCQESLMALMQQVTSADVINNPSYTVEWKVAMMKQIFDLLNQAQDFSERIRINDADLILKKLASDSANGDLNDLQNDPVTQEFMKRLRNISLNIKDKENGTDS